MHQQNAHIRFIVPALAHTNETVCNGKLKQACFFLLEWVSSDGLFSFRPIFFHFMSNESGPRCVHEKGYFHINLANHKHVGKRILLTVFPLAIRRSDFSESKKERGIPVVHLSCFAVSLVLTGWFSLTVAHGEHNLSPNEEHSEQHICLVQVMRHEELGNGPNWSELKFAIIICNS